MKRGTQRGIYTILTLGAVGYGLYFANKRYGGQMASALDQVLAPLTGGTTAGTTAESPYLDAERMEAAPSPTPDQSLFDSMFSDLMGFKDDILRALVPETVAGAVGPTGDPSSDTLLQKMFADLKDYKAGMISYLTYLQGEYIQPGGGSGGSGFASRGVAEFT